MRVFRKLLILGHFSLFNFKLNKEKLQLYNKIVFIFGYKLKVVPSQLVC